MSAAGPRHDLLTAFDVVTGRARTAPGAIDPSLLALTRRLVAFGRVIAADTPCPKPWIRRAEALFEARRPSLAAAVWAILFDSSASLSPAVRGLARSRFLRVGGEGGSIEAELVGIGTADVKLVGALEGATRATTIVLEPATGSPVRAVVAEGGTFELAVPARASSFTLSLRVGRRLVATSAPIALASSGSPP